MKTTKFNLIRDEKEVIFVFTEGAWLPGLKDFGTVTLNGSVVVRGKLAGDVACDFIRDMGIEPIRNR